MLYVTTLVVYLYAFSAQAYVGPGPGLSMLGSALGFIAAVGFAVLVVIAYPLRLLLMKLRGRNKEGDK